VVVVYESSPEPDPREELMGKVYVSRIVMAVMCMLIWWPAVSIASEPDEAGAKGWIYPRPTGPFPVGSRYLFLEDPERQDPYSENPKDRRWISTKVWYPAVPGPNAQPAPFGDDQFSRTMVEAGFFDARFLDEVALQQSASYPDAPVGEQDAPWPVLIFSSSGVMTANVFLFEEFASHGYFVVVVGHPYWCEFYFDGQGEMFHFDKNNRFYVEMWKEERSEAVIKTKEAITRSTDDEERMTLFGRLNELMPTEVADLAHWQADIDFVLDELTRLNTVDGPLRHKIDVQRVGILGYSKGGALAGQVCATSGRVKAGANLGGFMFGGLVEHDLAKPFVILEHIEPWCRECQPVNLSFLNRSLSDAYMIQIGGANHATFTDLPILKDYILADGILSPLDGKWSATVVRSYLVAFFDTYVKGEPRARLLEEQRSPFEQVRFIRHVESTDY
jgi:hypothetical protein